MELQSKLASTCFCVQINSTVGGVDIVAIEYIPCINTCKKVQVADGEFREIDGYAR